MAAVFIALFHGTKLSEDLQTKVSHIQGKAEIRTYWNRKRQIEEIGYFLTEHSALDALFGDFTIDHYERYDSQYWNLIRNDGLLVALYFVAVFLFVTFMGIRKAKAFIVRKQYEIASILLGISISMLAMLIVNLNGTAFLNRFPLNLMVYMLAGIIMLIQHGMSDGQKSPIQCDVVPAGPVLRDKEGRK
jgi:hypothetical protein